MGLLPEDLELSRKISSFLKNSTCDQFSAAIGTDTKFHDLKKGILRTVGFRFETTTVSNLEKQHFLKPAKLQDSESVCQAQSVLDETTSTLIEEDFGVRSGRSFRKT